MVCLQIIEQLLKIVFKGLCKLLRYVVNVVTRVSINIKQGWTVL